MAIALMIVVERAVKVLDFVGTIFFWHFWFTWILTGFPGFNWFIFNLIFFIMLAFAGEYGCLKQETAEIKLSLGHILGKGKKKLASSEEGKPRQRLDIDEGAPLKSLA
jgi:hypothetical protein